MLKYLTSIHQLSILPQGGIVKPSDAMDFFIMEIWKDIKGYEGKYQISNLGNVKSIGRLTKFGTATFFVKEKILKTYISEKRLYYGIALRDNLGKQKNKQIHRMIAEAFIPNPQKKPCINHKDGNKLNNDINNLEWVTHAENMRHAFSTGLYKSFGENHPHFKISDETVSLIREDYKNGMRYSAIARKYGFSPGHVNDICNNRKRKKETIKTTI